MTTRTDPMIYHFDILEKKSEQIRRVPIQCWWAGDASINGLRSMCDCQLGAYFQAEPSMRDRQTGGPLNDWGNFFAGAQFSYLKEHHCDHKPSRKFQAMRAHLPGGDVIEIAA